MNLSHLVSSVQDYIQPTRNFSLAYIIIDTLCVITFVVLLFLKKRRITAFWALAGGLLYFLVDFGYFYLISGSREIFLAVGEESFSLCSSFQTALVLFWMSMSYGILDFAFIWLWLSKDEYRKEFTWLIIIFWTCIPLTASIFNNSLPDSMINFMTTRSTGKYHGFMALIMLVGYLIVIIMNLFNKDKEKIPVLRLFVIGFMAQFMWEFALLVFGVRSQIYADDALRQILTLLQDSLIETNLGLPYIYFINKAVMSRWNEDLTSKKLKVATN
ncbi:MAG: hypothetical protein WCR67_00875 [Bacilli bacterium]